MKHRDAPLRAGLKGPGLPGIGVDSLLEALLSMRSRDEMRRLLEDLCTPAEIEALADRWRVVPLLLADTPYREIHDRTSVSVTTIGRIARALSFGAGGYGLAAERVLKSIPRRVARKGRP